MHAPSKNPENNSGVTHSSRDKTLERSRALLTPPNNLLPLHDGHNFPLLSQLSTGPTNPTDTVKLLAHMVSDAMTARSDVMLLGAGFSLNATGTDWPKLGVEIGKEIIRRGKELPSNWDSLAVPDKAEEFLKIFQGHDERCLLEDLVYKHTRIKDGFPGETELAILSRFKTKGGYIITTNYDNLIERTLEQLGIPFTVVADEEQLNPLCPKPPLNGVLLIKLHGDFASRNMVISRRDYNDYAAERPRMLERAIEMLGEDFPVCYGYGLSDSNIDQTLPIRDPDYDRPLGFAFGAKVDKDRLAFANRHKLAVLDFQDIPAMVEGMKTLAENIEHSLKVMHSDLYAVATALKNPDLVISHLLPLVKLLIAQAAQFAEETGQNLGAQERTELERSLWNSFQAISKFVAMGLVDDPKLFTKMGTLMLKNGFFDSARNAFSLARKVVNQDSEKEIFRSEILLQEIEVLSKLLDHRAVLRTFSKLADRVNWRSSEECAHMAEGYYLAICSAQALVKPIVDAKHIRRAELIYMRILEELAPHLKDLHKALGTVDEAHTESLNRAIKEGIKLLEEIKDLLGNTKMRRRDRALKLLDELAGELQSPAQTSSPYSIDSIPIEQSSLNIGFFTKVLLIRRIILGREPESE